MRLFAYLLLCALLLLVVCSQPLGAEVTLRLDWERPIEFRVVDAETGEAVAKPLLIIKTEKQEEGAPGPIAYYDVLEGSENGRVPFKASERISGVEVSAVAVDYALLTQKVRWKDLPDRQRDAYGLDIGPVPEISITLKNLSRDGRWQSNFRLTIAPELEDLTQIKPPFLSTDDKRLISDFLNREHNRMLGF